MNVGKPPAKWKNREEKALIEALVGVYRKRAPQHIREHAQWLEHWPDWLNMREMRFRADYGTDPDKNWSYRLDPKQVSKLSWKRGSFAFFAGRRAAEKLPKPPYKKGE